MKRKIISENLEQDSLGEVQAAKIQLKSILDNAQQLLNHIEGNETMDLDPWVQSKLSIADEYVTSTKKFIIHGDVEDEEEYISPGLEYDMLSIEDPGEDDIATPDILASPDDGFEDEFSDEFIDVGDEDDEVHVMGVDAVTESVEETDNLSRKWAKLNIAKTDEESRKEAIHSILYGGLEYPNKLRLERMSDDEIIDLYIKNWEYESGYEWDSDEEDEWTDPAGGRHKGDEDDPVRMYEAETSEYWKVELRDFAAENLRDVPARNEDDLVRLTEEALWDLGYKFDDVDFEAAMEIVSNYVDIQYGEEESDVAMITVKKGKYSDDWWLKKIDSTHFYLSNDPDKVERGWPYHIGQHRGKPYYEDVRKWLHSGPSPDGKVYHE